MFVTSASAEFVESGPRVMYRDANGKYLTGLQQINNAYYYFNSLGELQTNGWIRTTDGKEYYADKNGVLLRNQWKGKGKKKYYLKDNAEKAKGLTRIGVKYYFFSLKNGKLMTGKIKDADGNLYITKKKGVVYAGKLFKYQSAKYYAYPDGKLAKGFTKIGNNYYFFKKTNGKMVTKKRKAVGNDFYYFSKSGYAVRERWVKISGNYYYFQQNGKMARNQFIGTKWYVGADGVRIKASKLPQAGVQKIDGVIYVYASTGKLLTNNWYNNGTDSYYADANGRALIGMQTIAGKSYYFNEEGKLQKDTVVQVNGSYYIAEADGHISGTTSCAGENIVAYAKKFLGLPYVWGGTSLKTGADCSGFVYTIYQKFGVQLMRVADDQRKGPTKAYTSLGYKVGTKVADKNLLPGDLVFYDSTKDGVADHVAMFIGNGQVIHEAGKKWGCVITAIDWASGRMKGHNMRYWA